MTIEILNLGIICIGITIVLMFTINYILNYILFKKIKKDKLNKILIILEKNEK